jgi:threonine/homoserine/homoserine lactone efflux protein
VASALLAGYLLGLAIAASPGAMGLLCIRRTLTSGWREGFSTGLGVATADAIYAGIAAAGITAITRLLLAQQRWLALGGGLALLALGLWGLRGARAATGTDDDATDAPRRAGPVACYASSIGLTLANPTTILSFAAAFSSLTTLGSLAPPFLVAGTFAGSTTWWLLLSGGTALARRRLSPRAIRILRTVSAAVLAALGLASMAGALLRPGG